MHAVPTPANTLLQRLAREADHSAPAIPAINRIPAELFAATSPSIGALKVFTADAGPTDDTTLAASLMMAWGWPIRPTMEIKAISAGKMASRP